ncbi:response regulator transcription factor [Bradyrhizobium sp. AUGA SZCCT0160]|uniref:response regulator transcription factor n=1 Tax=Bradyrhizobium sp. AUGA SZCCT0160 TaxID=2807662 RepID=UPI001BA6E0BE|nr:response regulator [Bradyrhizobium sp. AUGA SZCCT0160]MBR1190375.1 response regulator [Bradyrhizobium sp. AUGA SZCCT0160]
MAEVSSWIAVVDDDPAVLKALSRLLRSHAYKVHTYGSGKEFLASLSDGLPRCLIVDLQMPVMGGQALQEHLIRNGYGIPTIMVTAHHDAAHQENLRLADLLLKPLQDSTLLAAIDRAINVPREEL